MNPLVIRTAVLAGTFIAALNIILTGMQYGFMALPIWLYLVQLLLIPAMLVPMRYFPQASLEPNFAKRALLYAQGWSVPYTIYKFSGDAVSPLFQPVVSVSNYFFTVIVFGLLMAAIRKPLK